MNSRVQPPRSAAEVRQACMRLALCLLPGTAMAEQSRGTARGAVATRPYLASLALPALRFAEALPPPDLSVRPPAGAPPSLPATDPVADPAAPESTPLTESSLPAQIPNDSVNRSPAKAANPPPPRIIPDDTRPAVRPEDFLPFFIFPGNTQGAGNPTVVLPGSLTPAPASPGTLPLSTATYRQQ
jgi:hypothetical protein